MFKTCLSWHRKWKELLLGEEYLFSTGRRNQNGESDWTKQDIFVVCNGYFEVTGYNTDFAYPVMYSTYC